MTTAVRTAPHHDTLTCYTDYGCRLPACHQRYREWDRDRYRQHADGQWQQLIDAGPVRTHIHQLYAAGFTDYRIAGLADTTPPTIHALGKRSYARDRGQQRRLAQALADRILAIDPAIALPARVPADGTRRRMQALVTAGWPLLHIATRAGISQQNVYRIFQRPVINTTTALAVAAAYDTLQQQRPERSGIAKASVNRARNHGRTRRWAPISYWNKPDHPIDDPDFRCDYGITQAQILAEEARWLMTAGGLNRDEAAGRLGKSRFYIDRALSEHPEPEPVAA